MMEVKKTEGKLRVCDVRTEECNVGVKQSAQDWEQQVKEQEVKRGETHHCHTTM